MGLALVAPPLVDLVFGARWHAAAAPLAWLAILAVVRILHELAYDFLAVLGQTRGLLAIQGLWLAALVPAVVIGARTGDPAGVALAQVLVATVVVLPAYGAQLRRTACRSEPSVGHSRPPSPAVPPWPSPSGCWQPGSRAAS